MNNTKIDKTALVFNPIVFVERQLYREKRKHLIYKSTFVFFNLLIFIATLSVAVVTPMVIGHVIEDQSGSTPTWYYFYSAIIPAFAGLMTAILNFFYINDKMKKSLQNFHFIQSEIILYSSGDKTYDSKDKDYLLFENVAKHIGYKSAKEVKNETI